MHSEACRRRSKGLGFRIEAWRGDARGRGVADLAGEGRTGSRRADSKKPEKYKFVCRRGCPEQPDLPATARAPNQRGAACRSPQQRRAHAQTRTRGHTHKHAGKTRARAGMYARKQHGAQAHCETSL